MKYTMAQVRKASAAFLATAVSTAGVAVGQALINHDQLNRETLLAVAGAAIVAGFGAGMLVFKVKNEDTDSHVV